MRRTAERKDSKIVKFGGTIWNGVPLPPTLPLALLVVASFARSAPAASPATEEPARLLAQVEPRLKAIYERDEFAVRSFTATWLPDGSGKRFDYFVYPNRDHGLREGKGSTVHVRMLIARYLVEHLPPGPR